MSAELFDVVQALGLRPGQVYRAAKDGRAVELRVFEEDDQPTAELAEMVMLNVIADYPYPEPGVIIQAKPGAVELSPPPDIPEDEGPA